MCCVMQILERPRGYSMQFRRTVTKQVHFFPQHAVFQNTNLNTETLHPRTKAFCGWGGGARGQ